LNVPSAAHLTGVSPLEQECCSEYVRRRTWPWRSGDMFKDTAKELVGLITAFFEQRPSTA
jgi:hypothetical protein